MRLPFAILLVVAGCGETPTQDASDFAMSIPADLASAADLSSPASPADLAAPADLTSSGTVGAPCTDDNQCSTGHCITEAMHAIYVGGYCSLLGCANGCPNGSVCTGGGAIGNTGCFEECTIGDPCRTGYKCCPIQFDLGGQGICVPTTGTALSC